MIAKCRPIEIIRKKFSDFEKYEENENEVFLVGYEIDSEGNKKNIKINAKDIKTDNSELLIPKALKIDELSTAPDGSNGYSLSFDRYNDNHYTVTFNVDVAEYFQIEKVNPEILKKENCDEYGIIIDVGGSLDKCIGKTTRIIMYNACPRNIESVNILYGDYIIGEVSYGQTVIIDIFHTFHSEIVIARSEDIEIIR